MTDFQRCQQAATASACPEKGTFLQLIPYHLELIPCAAEAYHRILNTRAIGPDWAPAYRAWLDAAESRAITVAKHAEQQEARRHD